MTFEPVLAFAWNPAVGVPMLIIGAIIWALIWFFGQPDKEQGKRRASSSGSGTGRHEPVLGGEPVDSDEPSFGALDTRTDDLSSMAAKPAQGDLEVGLREELERLGATLAGGNAAPVKPQVDKPRSTFSAHVASIVDALRAPPVSESANEDVKIEAPLFSEPTATQPAKAHEYASPAKGAADADVPARSDLGRRPTQMPVERIVTLFVVAHEGSFFEGPDLIVAAEKAGLEFGDMGIYHRLVDGKRELGPIFSVANMLKPGSFDLTQLDLLRTPGVSFFMTLPAPLPALDAWDAMLPTAQRLAELLEGQVLDEERNALGRQRIAHIRDQLRGWDRDHEGEEVIFGR
ncbi:MAG: cell division protein ZipA [Rhodanobacter sp.]